MTKCLFFCGRGANEPAAVSQALEQCNDLLLNFPSLVVELVEMVPNASGYDAHLRVMAISANIDTKKIKQKEQNPFRDLSVKPSDDLGRKEGVEHEVNISRDDRRLFAMASFDLAVTNGMIPDIPTQDLDQFKGLGMSVEDVRACLNNRQSILQQQLNIDSH